MAVKEMKQSLNIRISETELFLRFISGSSKKPYMQEKQYFCLKFPVRE